ncbi:hypothetical protein PVAP13_1NG297619 [Panicum virgatum]|uniref:Uncharacterized protein n=1 Tax=Panicum virgatum TaxID=38727 RepID=A0A8T0X7E8_PANVG|nr:hypothetical protein PVAP13_1NG297619 [Panicum virgatum]
METKETYLPMTLFGSSKKRKPILDPLPPPGPRPHHHRARPRCSVVRLRAGVARLALRPPPSSAATTTSVSRRRPLRRAPDFQYSTSPADALRYRRAPSAVASRLRRRPGYSSVPSSSNPADIGPSAYAHILARRHLPPNSTGRPTHFRSPIHERYQIPVADSTTTARLRSSSPHGCASPSQPS